MKSTTSFDLTMSAIRLWASLTDYLLRHRGFELQCVKLTPYSTPERGIDRLMLPDPVHSREAPAHHPRRIMIAVAGEVANGHVGVGNGGFDHRLDLGCGHR